MFAAEAGACVSEHEFLGGRWLRVRELDAPVRNIVFTTFAVFLAVALATALGSRIGGPPLDTFALFHFPQNIFIGGVVVVVAGASLLLAGAAHLKTRWRYPMIAMIMLAIFATRYAVPGLLPDKIFYPLTWLPAPFVLAIAVLAWIAPRHRLTTVLLLSFAICAGFAASILAATFFFGPVRVTDTAYVPSIAYAVSVFTVVMGAVGLAVTPAIMVVGFDAAELGAEGVAVGLRFLPKFRGAALWLGLLLPAAGLALMAKMIFDFRDQRSANIGFMITLAVLIAAGCAVWLALARRRPHPGSGGHSELGYLPVLCVAICIFASTIVNLNFSENIPGYQRFDGSRAFAVRLPDDVQKKHFQSAAHANQGTLADFYFGPKSPIIGLNIVAAPEIGSSLPFYPLAALANQRNLPSKPVTLGAADRNGWQPGQVHLPKIRLHRLRAQGQQRYGSVGRRLVHRVWRAPVQPPETSSRVRPRQE